MEMSCANCDFREHNKCRLLAGTINLGGFCDGWIEKNTGKCRDCGDMFKIDPEDRFDFGRGTGLCMGCLFKRLQESGKDIPDLPCDEDDDL